MLVSNRQCPEALTSPSVKSNCGLIKRVAGTALAGFKGLNPVFPEDLHGHGDAGVDGPSSVIFEGRRGQFYGRIHRPMSYV